MSAKSLPYNMTALLDRVDGYQLAGALFIKLLALIYFAAFLSLSTQITGLVGVNGILPFTELLDQLYQKHGMLAWLYMPTLFWFDSSNFVLEGVTLIGCAVSLLLFIGVKPAFSLTALFILYLSLYHAGQTFLTFQWDTLLLEAGFLAIFITRGPSHLLIFMFHWLLFRLRFMSGISKLASGDPSWSNLTTLNYYFETQPLPHVGAWYFHQLPEWILQAGVLLVFFTELIVPFFIFLPRKFRLFAAATTIVMQLLIIASSNHNWINLLTILLCLFLLDDRILKKIVPQWILSFTSIGVSVDAEPRIPRCNFVLFIFSLLILVSSVSVFTGMLSTKNSLEPLAKTTSLVRVWGLGHIFHIFPNMQTERHELQIEGSYDGRHWQSYGFKYKPGSLYGKPEFIVPHQPRLDWMIWFVPPKHPEMMYWFDRFLLRLKQGSTDVLDLLEHNPFPSGPPTYLRVQVFKYRFTSMQEREHTGQWWKREYLGQFPYARARHP